MITYVTAQQSCQLTDADILGPYYHPGAPTSTGQICANLPAHDRLILTGQVLDYESKCQRGIPNVKLDLWQANYNGVYSGGQSANDWWCRGVITTDSNGKFRITTLFPGRYDDGGYRPAHIHFKVTAQGYPTFVTQLYFNLDYYLSPRDSCKRCRSDAKTLVVSAAHRDDIKTFEGLTTSTNIIKDHQLTADTLADFYEKYCETPTFDPNNTAHLDALKIYDDFSKLPHFPLEKTSLEEVEKNWKRAQKKKLTDTEGSSAFVLHQLPTEYLIE
ncbi:unnamed protein product [Rotaria sordida]|uniref:Intradiol ring-cleavage dioxygenases domain-containing protein n=1 Tax=Rotaria sordida TaxID=392033 RepID=A0A815B728_9BILA|nr:unnamed protein product [Rotaria sordida]CAF1543534.1 unnamed protein product [Rotaria sordida]